jgi:dTDP-4-amino-4,6-dideoxygalactose transaminase
MIHIAKPIMGNEEKRAVMGVLSSGNLAQGERVEKFEKAFARFIGTKYCVAVNSGTAALHLALLALGIKNKDEIITTSFSFSASANCALFCGAYPVFSDIDPMTFNINPYDIENKITKKSKCVIPVHLYGQPADMKPIKEVATKHDLFIVEDCAQAHGAEYKNKKVGSIGDLGCFSFYATKNMTTGEGGVITTNIDELAEKLQLLRNHGQTKRYCSSILGFNFRMTDIAAALGIEQLKKLKRFNKKRILNAKFLTKNFDGIGGLITPFISPNVTHVFNNYTIRITNRFKLGRESLIEKLKNDGIETRIYYPVPIHKQPLYVKLGYEKISLSETDKASNEVLSLPVHPSLTKNDLNYMAEKINSFK